MTWRAIGLLDTLNVIAVFAGLLVMLAAVRQTQALRLPIECGGQVAGNLVVSRQRPPFGSDEELLLKSMLHTPRWRWSAWK